MANSELAGKQYTIPSHVLSLLQAKTQDGEGVDRINGMLSSRKATYEQLKFLKNNIENTYKTDWSKILAWVNNVLTTDRSSIDNRKEVLSNIGMENQYRSAHFKSNTVSKLTMEEKKVVKITKGQLISMVNEMVVQADGGLLKESVDASSSFVTLIKDSTYVDVEGIYDVLQLDKKIDSVDFEDVNITIRWSVDIDSRSWGIKSFDVAIQSVVGEMTYAIAGENEDKTGDFTFDSIKDQYSISSDFDSSDGKISLPLYPTEVEIDLIKKHITVMF